MASIKAFRVNVEAVNEGGWVPVGDGDDQFEIKTRGFTGAYRNKVAALRREAARKANRTLPPGSLAYSVDVLPTTLDDECQGQASAEELFLDVRGLSNDDRSPVTADQFRDMLRHPDEYQFLVSYVIQAAAVIHASRVADKEAAAGN